MALTPRAAASGCSHARAADAANQPFCCRSHCSSSAARKMRRRSRSWLMDQDGQKKKKKKKKKKKEQRKRKNLVPTTAALIQRQAALDFVYKSKPVLEPVPFFPFLPLLPCFILCVCGSSMKRFLHSFHLQQRLERDAGPETSFDASTPSSHKCLYRHGCQLAKRHWRRPPF